MMTIANRSPMMRYACILGPLLHTAGATGSARRASLRTLLSQVPCAGTRESAPERRAVGPADLEADIGRVVEVARVLGNRERPHRGVDAMAHADRDLILGLEQPFEIGVLVREHARAYVVLGDDAGSLADAVFVAEDVGRHDLRAVVRRQGTAFSADRGRADVTRVPSGEALQRRLQAYIGISGRQKFPLPVNRNLYRAFQHEIPGRGRRRDRIAYTECRIEHATVRRGIQKERGIRTLEVEDDVDAVAGNRRPAKRT